MTTKNKFSGKNTKSE